MKTISLSFLVTTILAFAASMANAQIWNKAHVAYVYPAGGQAGTTFEVTVGGKGINRIKDVEITGGGVRGEFVQHIGNYQQKLQEQFRTIQAERSGKKRIPERKFGPRPEHDLFTRIEEMPDTDLRIIAAKFQQKERVQRNRELAELTVIKVTIDPRARPGMRELRLVTTNGGASNPIRFMVNSIPEIREYEPNDLASPEQSHMQLPGIINGQIMPGDEDKFSFDAQKGQQLVIQVKARELVPYLADAVPGWFQAVIAVHNDKGKEIAYADDFQFNPDPALLFEVPETGKYHVTIRDSIYRGREDFVYRIAVGELPFVTGIYPLGGQKGTKAAVTAYGWNLHAGGFNLNTKVRDRTTKKGLLNANGVISNYVHYEVGTLSESTEVENNNQMKGAGLVNLESTVNGRIDAVGDVDFFKFRATKDQKIKVSTNARRLYSPVDTLIRVFDTKGNVLAWNDDMEGCGNMTDRTGLITHNSDSELEFTAPANGVYFVQVMDTQNKGGPTHAYRLDIVEPKPGFDIYVTPSSITIPSGGAAKAILHVRRNNGYTGPIDVKVANKSKGLSISGGHIPENCDTIAVVIRTERNVSGGKSGINLVASASIDGENILKRVIPADDITQAFITHHLVEKDVLTAHILRNSRKPPNFKKEPTEQKIISAETPALVSLNMNVPQSDLISFDLEDAPEGISMETKRIGMKGTSLEFKASDDLETDLAGNLIVGIYYQPKPTAKNKNPRKVSVGVLPAIPYRTQ